MNKYSMKQIKDSLPSDKKKDDSFIALYAARPLSYPITYFCVNAGVSAWLVSVISVIVAAIACICFWVNSSMFRWSGCVLVFFWSILDCVDGNVARVTNSSNEMGSFMDAESGYILSALLYLSYGIAAFNTSGRILEDSKYIYIILGACASISDVLARLIHQRYTVSILSLTDKRFSKKMQKATFTRVRKRISAEIGIAGFAIVAGVLGELFHMYDMIVSFYALYCVLSLILVICLYSVKARN